MLHKWGDSLSNLTKKRPQESLFTRLKEAFDHRTPGARYFDSTRLGALGLVERVWTPTSLEGHEDPYLAFTQALDKVLSEIKNQQKEQNTAFVLKLLPPKLGKGIPFHTLTITCDGLWIDTLGFGFQETTYSQTDKGIPSRHLQWFAEKDDFRKALYRHISHNSLGYTVSKLQAVTIEKYPQTPMTRAFNTVLSVILHQRRDTGLFT